MALNTATIKEWAERLDESEQSHKQVEHISVGHPDITIDDAYAVQRAWVAISQRVARLASARESSASCDPRSSAAPSSSSASW